MSKVLVLGSGAREHALAWKLAQSPHVTRVILSPGAEAVEECLHPLKPCERWEYSEAIFARAKKENVSLVVVGPDQMLADGVVDRFMEMKIPVFGPTQSAARIESSKAFSKSLMKRAGVPTAEFEVFSEQKKAEEYLKKVPAHSWGEGRGWVLKADGLALGKGVSVCDSLEVALIEMERLFGISKQLVIEERLSGEEISWMALCDGETVTLLDPARDYKRLRDHQQGPNTGGMGAYSPVKEALEGDLSKCMIEQVFRPVLRELVKQGCPFRGILYAGLMWNRESNRWWVLEFNARFGDPETQALLPRLESDLYEWFFETANGKLDQKIAKDSSLRFSDDFCVYVVASAQGYPESPRKGDAIEGLQVPGKGFGSDLFMAGVARKNGIWVTSGGRVLGALGKGESLSAARARAYHRLGQIKFRGKHIRNDVGGEGGKA